MIFITLSPDSPKHPATRNMVCELSMLLLEILFSLGLRKRGILIAHTDPNLRYNEVFFTVLLKSVRIPCSSYTYISVWMNFSYELVHDCYDGIHYVQPVAGWGRVTLPFLCFRQPLSLETVSPVREYCNLNNVAAQARFKLVKWRGFVGRQERVRLGHWDGLWLHVLFMTF